MIFSHSIPELKLFLKESQLDLTKTEPDISEVDSGIGDSSIAIQALNLAKQYADLSRIKYIGLTGDASVLGIADTEYNNQLLNNLLQEIMQAKQNWDQYSAGEQQQIENINIEVKKLKNNMELVAFQVNPENIISTADQYMNGIQQEVEASGRTFEDLELVEDQVRNDLVTLILASVFAHEGTHAIGGGEMQGEGGAEQSETSLLKDYIYSPSSSYNYLSQFRIIQENIQ